jgi:Uma2 family endonuclease
MVVVRAMGVPTQVRRIPMSREQFLQLPEGPPFYDYVNGEAIEVNRPSIKHQEILLALSASLHAHVQTHALGKVLIEVNLELPNGNIYTPDILFYSHQTAGQIDVSRGYVRGVPDLVVEILSPSTADYDRTQKMGDYAACGVPWVWLVDQETLLIEEYQWTPEGYLRRQAVDAQTPFHPYLFPELTLQMAHLTPPPEGEELE